MAKTGRPSSFRPEYCEQVVKHMADGYSLTAFGGSIGVCADTLTDWQARYPEFLRAVKRARAARLQFLEKRLYESESSARVTSSIFALKCTNKEEWGEVSRFEHTGKDGGSIKVEEVSDADLLQIAGVKQPGVMAGRN